MNAVAYRLTFPLLVASLYFQAFSGFVDVYSHRFIFVDEDPVILNPAHIWLFMSTALAIYCSYILRRYGVGFLVVFYGVFLELLSGVLNEVFHATVGDIHPISPPHAMLVVGMIVSQVGSAIATFTVVSMGSSIARALALSLLWATSMGSAIYVANTLAETGLMQQSLAVVSIATGVVVGGFISVAPLGTMVTSSMIFYIFNQIPLAAMAGYIYTPLGVLVAFILEAVKKIRVSGSVKPVVGGAVSGASIYLLHYPYLQSIAVEPDILFLSIAVASVLGAASGYIGLQITRYIDKALRKRMMRSGKVNHQIP